MKTSFAVGSTFLSWCFVHYFFSASSSSYLPFLYRNWCIVESFPFIPPKLLSFSPVLLSVMPKPWSSPQNCSDFFASPIHFIYAFPIIFLCCWGSPTYAPFLFNFFSSFQVVSLQGQLQSSNFVNFLHSTTISVVGWFLSSPYYLFQKFTYFLSAICYLPYTLPVLH